MIGYFAFFNKKSEFTYTEEIGDGLDENLILQKGSSGNEVKKLQELLKINSDGVFGNQTEQELFKIKGVLKISLKQFINSPSINQNPIKIGSKVMANVDPTNIFNAIKKADGTYYSDYKIIDKFNYGKEIGVIKGHNATKTWYMVEIDGFFFNTIAFVKSTDVKQYK